MVEPFGICRSPLARFIVMALVLGAIGVVAGCFPTAGAKYRLLDLEPIPIAMPNGDYGDVVWLQDGMLALNYGETADTPFYETKLMFFDMNTGGQQLVELDSPPECNGVGLGWFGTLPDGRLGYQIECIPWKRLARDFRLHVWDPVTQTDEQFYQFPIPFWAGHFSFAPDMQRWVQEQPMLESELHLYEIGQEPQRLLEQSFDRVADPTWLADGRLLFSGVPKLPEEKTNIFSGAPGLWAQISAPETIYLADWESVINDTVNEEHAVLSGIVFLDDVTLSPDRRRIAFSGEYKKKRGIWLYDLETGDLARIVADTSAVLSWSPDGNQLLMLMKYETKYRLPNQHVYLVDVAATPVRLPE